MNKKFLAIYGFFFAPKVWTKFEVFLNTYKCIKKLKALNY